MAKLVTLLELHSDRRPPTVVIVQATTWWEIVHGHVKLIESGLGVHLHVKVRCNWRLSPMYGYMNQHRFKFGMTYDTYVQIGVKLKL